MPQPSLSMRHDFKCFVAARCFHPPTYVINGRCRTKDTRRFRGGPVLLLIGEFYKGRRAASALRGRRVCHWFAILTPDSDLWPALCFPNHVDALQAITLDDTVDDEDQPGVCHGRHHATLGSSKCFVATRCFTRTRV